MLPDNRVQEICCNEELRAAKSVLVAHNLTLIVSFYYMIVAVLIISFSFVLFLLFLIWRFSTHFNVLFNSKVIYR